MPSLWLYVELARCIVRDLGIFLFCKTLYYAWPSKLRYVCAACWYVAVVKLVKHCYRTKLPT